MLYLDRGVVQVLQAADFYDKGLPPAEGAWLDQLKQFTDACRWIWNEQRYWKNELGILW